MPAMEAKVLNIEPWHQNSAISLFDILYFCHMCVPKKFLLSMILLAAAYTGFAQTDSIQPPPEQNIDQPVRRRAVDSGQYASADSILRRVRQNEARLLRDSLYADSVKKAAIPAVSAVITDTSTYRKYEPVSFISLSKPPVYMLIDYRPQPSKDDLFYLMAGIVFVLAFIRATFSKYFRNLFLLFRQTSLRQKQTRDQLLQDNLASLLTNFLFVISAGLYVTLVIRYKGWSDLPFWWLAGGSAAALLLIYLVKYLFLLFTGWVFNTREAAGSYVFVVFLVNKVLGVILVPFLLIFAFAGPELVQIGLTLSAGVLLLLLGYRYWVSFNAIRGKLKVNALHFLLYLCAVELLPLALICKVLMNYFNGSL
jgi:hypothetical protein